MEEGAIVWTAKGPCPACGKTNARRVKGPGYAALKCRSCHAITDVLAQKLRIGPTGPVPVAPSPPHSLPTLVRRQRAAAARRRVWGGITGLVASLLLLFVIGVMLAPSPTLATEGLPGTIAVSLAVDGNPDADVSFTVELWLNDAKAVTADVTRLANATGPQAHALGAVARADAVIRFVSAEGAPIGESAFDFSACGEDAVVHLAISEAGVPTLDAARAC